MTVGTQISLGLQISVGLTSTSVHPYGYLAIESVMRKQIKRSFILNTGT